MAAPTSKLSPVQSLEESEVESPGIFAEACTSLFRMVSSPEVDILVGQAGNTVIDGGAQSEPGSILASGAGKAMAETVRVLRQ